MILLGFLAGCGDPPTLTEVQDQVFTPSCAFSSCHGGRAGGLDLTEGASYAELVDVPVVGTDRPDYPDVDVSGWSRVVPGDSEASYLVRKCTSADGIKGAPMPDGTDGLDADRLALLRQWIDAGALDD